MKNNPEQIVEEIFALFDQQGGNEYIGEPVTILEHSLQAGQLAIDVKEEPLVVLASFFHDIGHLLPMQASEDMEGMGHLRHEVIGADFLISKGLPENMAILVKNHVQAKRYLTYKHPKYFEQLSDASKITLKYQGGVMTADEAEAFEKHPLFKKSLQLRAWDEQAKLTDCEVQPLDFYRKLLLEFLVKHI